MEDEISRKDDEIRNLREKQLSNSNAQRTLSNGFGEDPESESAYSNFLQKRLDECLAENKRYHEKYVDMREFAYSSVESLMRKLNMQKKNAIQNSNLNVYK